MNARRILLAVGTAVAGLGLVLAVVPGLAAAYPLQRGVIVLVAILALLAGVRTLSRRRTARMERVETGAPETLIDLPAPGDETRRSFERATSLTLTETREKVQQRLHEAAVAVVRRRYDCSESAAREMLASGEWTDDPHAAAFFADPEQVRTPRVPPQVWVSDESPFTYRARRTVDALVALTGMEVET